MNNFGTRDPVASCIASTSRECGQLVVETWPECQQSVVDGATDQRCVSLTSCDNTEDSLFTVSVIGLCLPEIQVVIQRDNRLFSKPSTFVVGTTELR